MAKLFSKNSNLCDHNPPTSHRDGQTDGETERQTTCDRNTALCTKVHRAVKSHLSGKKNPYKFFMEKPSQNHGVSRLPYGVTQCYLSPDTSEHTPTPLTPASEAGTYTRFTFPVVWKAEAYTMKCYARK